MSQVKSEGREYGWEQKAMVAPGYQGHYPGNGPLYESEIMNIGYQVTFIVSVVLVSRETRHLCMRGEEF